MIYPLAEQPGLFRIQIFSKPAVPPFGPLRDGMLVPRALLAPLVRATAVNANRAVRYMQQSYGRPYPTRAKYVEELISRHRQADISPHDLFARFWPLSLNVTPAATAAGPSAASTPSAVPAAAPSAVAE